MEGSNLPDWLNYLLYGAGGGGILGLLKLMQVGASKVDAYTAAIKEVHDEIKAIHKKLASIDNRMVAVETSVEFMQRD